MSDFAQRVYDKLKEVSARCVTTYGDLAIAVGCPGGGRAVGGALNKNIKIGVIPCHRVVRSSGLLGGFVLGREAKIVLLAG